MKLNYELGDFTSNNSVDPALANMSLSMITVFSGFRLMHGSRTITNTNVVDQGGTGIDVNANETRYVRRVRFASGTSLASRVFEMDLDSIPYESGGTSYTAFGQLIPVKMGSITWGRMTTAGNITTQTGTAMYGVVMLYAVNFPTWNGNAIIHDPVFSTFIPSTDGGKNLWVVIVIAVAGIAAVVIIIGVVKAKKRDSSYPGYHVDTRREVKSRPRHAPEHLSVDFLHSFLILFGNNAAGLDGSEPMIDKYDPDMFCFFSGIIHEIIGGLRVKDGAWKKISSKKQDDDVTVPETVLDPRIFISSEKIPETVGTGKVYVYSMKSHNSQGIWMLDALLFVNPEWIARLSLYSTGVLDEMTARRLLPSIRALAKAISEHQEGKNEGEIQRLVERYLPTSLARPRDIVLPAVSTFLNHVRTDNGFAGDDVDAIENDLEMLSMEQADSIISAFASRVREQQEQDKEGINKTRET